MLWRRSYFTTCSKVSIVKFEHVITGWVAKLKDFYFLQRKHFQ